MSVTISGEKNKTDDCSSNHLFIYKFDLFHLSNQNLNPIVNARVWSVKATFAAGFTYSTS